MKRIPWLLSLWFLVLGWCCRTEPFSSGKESYNLRCANCHMQDGEGLKGIIPALSRSAYLDKRILEIACLIRQGKASSVPGLQGMPAQPGLNAVEITNILNYLEYRWGKEQRYIQVTDVEETLKACQPLPK